MNTLYFDCYSGVSGDMILGALLDLGIDREAWLKRLHSLAVSGWEIRFERQMRQGMDVQRVIIEVQDAQPERHLSDVLEIIDSSNLPQLVKLRASEVFTCLAKAEARVHGCSVERVHFHEVGAVDAIVDVVGACLALELLNVEKVYSSPIGVGQGTAEAAHGRMPLPPPATLEILRGCPVRFSGLETELATPTGAAILKTLATFATPSPGLLLQSVGYGAGAKVIPELPNVLRALLLTAQGELWLDQAMLIETNIDDLNPEVYPHVMQKLLDAGAMDAYLIPVIMKKGRPGVIISVLGEPGKESQLTEVLYRETSTLGVRISRIDRHKLPRREISVETELGAIRGKEAQWRDLIRRTPEFEDCRRIAQEQNVPLQRVYEAFNRASAKHKE